MRSIIFPTFVYSQRTVAGLNLVLLFLSSHLIFVHSKISSEGHFPCSPSSPPFSSLVSSSSIPSSYNADFFAPFLSTQTHLLESGSKESLRQLLQDIAVAVMDAANLDPKSFSMDPKQYEWDMASLFLDPLTGNVKDLKLAINNGISKDPILPSSTNHHLRGLKAVESDLTNTNPQGVEGKAGVSANKSGLEALFSAVTAVATEGEEESTLPSPPPIHVTAYQAYLSQVPSSSGTSFGGFASAATAITTATDATSGTGSVSSTTPSTSSSLASSLASPYLFNGPLANEIRNSTSISHWESSIQQLSSYLYNHGFEQKIKELIPGPDAETLITYLHTEMSLALSSYAAGPAALIAVFALCLAVVAAITTLVASIFYTTAGATGVASSLASFGPLINTTDTSSDGYYNHNFPKKLASDQNLTGLFKSSNPDQVGSSNVNIPESSNSSESTEVSDLEDRLGGFATLFRSTTTSNNGNNGNSGANAATTRYYKNSNVVISEGAAMAISALKRIFSSSMNNHFEASRTIMEAAKSVLDTFGQPSES